MKVLKRIALMIGLIIGGCLVLLIGFGLYSALTQGTNAPSNAVPVAAAATNSPGSANADAAFATGNVPILPVVVGTNMVGCTSRDEMQSIATMITGGNRKNAAILMSQEVDRGACQWFIAGETVYIEAIVDPFAKIERPGEADGYWTVAGALHPLKQAHGTVPK